MTARDAPVRSTSAREDVLVSACFGDLAADSASFDAVVALAQTLDAHFRFREIVVVAEESRKDAYLPLVRSIDNLRLLIVRDGTAFYRRHHFYPLDSAPALDIDNGLTGNHFNTFGADSLRQ